jgi:hypothetical protein
MADLEKVNGQYLIRLSGMLLIFTRDELVRAWKRGKSYRRREQQAKRVIRIGEEDPHG